MRRKARKQFLLCQQHRHVGIVEHERAAFVRILGIDRHIRATCLQDAEQSDHEFE